MSQKCKQTSFTLRRCILFWTAVFAGGMLLLAVMLWVLGYQFLQWVNCVSAALVFLAIPVGTIQLLRRKMLICILVTVLEVLALLYLGCFSLLFITPETVVEVNGRPMIQEQRGFLVGVNEYEYYYYDFESIYVRSSRARFYIDSDKTIRSYDPKSQRYYIVPLEGDRWKEGKIEKKEPPFSFSDSMTEPGRTPGSYPPSFLPCPTASN